MVYRLDFESDQHLGPSRSHTHSATPMRDAGRVRSARIPLCRLSNIRSVTIVSYNTATRGLLDGFMMPGTWCRRQSTPILPDAAQSPGFSRGRSDSIYAGGAVAELADISLVRQASNPNGYTQVIMPMHVAR